MTRRLIYSMTVSLDGFVAGPSGEIDWSAPDEELHRFHNEQTRELGAHLCGRRLYEVMVYWETADRNPSASDYELEFARIWRNTPKVVFSSTLQPPLAWANTQLVGGDAVEAVAAMKRGAAGPMRTLGSLTLAGRSSRRAWSTVSAWSSSP